MATVENLPSPSTERPIGFGRLKRKEDARFIRGQGTYLDDIGCRVWSRRMLRSPYAHARIVSIDTSRALAHPNVAAVVTARTWRRWGWPGCRPSPTTQAVLARQGAFPGPGGRVRDRDQRVLRQKSFTYSKRRLDCLLKVFLFLLRLLLALMIVMNLFISIVTTCWNISIVTNYWKSLLV